VAKKIIPPPVNTVEFGFHIGVGQPKPMAAADQHNEIELNYVICGNMWLRRGAETVILDSGQAAIHWAAVPHQVIKVEAETTIAWLVIPLAWFLSWKLSPAFNQRILSGGILPPGKDFGERVAGWARDFGKSGELDLAIKLEIEALFRRLALSPGVSPQSLALATSNAQLCRHTEKIVFAITQHFREQITVAGIAKMVGLHPEYAMRLFRNQWGITLWSFLLNQRIAEARRLLVFSDAPVTDIAFACGFQSLGRFYASFRKQCGCTPLAYRRSHL